MREPTPVHGSDPGSRAATDCDLHQHTFRQARIDSSLLEPLLPSIAAPTLMVWRAHDRVLNPGAATSGRFCAMNDATTRRARASHSTNGPNPAALRRLSMSYRIALPLLLAVAGVTGTTAAASTAPAQSVRVRYADLDLTRDVGVTALYSRLREAASEVCNPPDTIDLHAAASYRACAARALDEAVASVNEARLTAVHVRSRSS